MQTDSDLDVDPDFDIDAVLRVLGSLADERGGSLEEARALRVAAVSLVFLRKEGKVDQYREFFRKFHTPATEVIKIAHTFATREDAMTWLQGPSASPGTLVKIAGVTHIAATAPEGLIFVRTLSPQEFEEQK